MLVHRAAIEHVGPMDEGYFLHCEDLDWCLRFGLAGLKILFVPDAMAVHYQGTCGADRPISVIWHMHRGMVRFYRKFHRERRTLPFSWMVFVAVWSRCIILAVCKLAAAIPRLGDEQITGESGTLRHSSWVSLLSESDRQRVVVVGATSVVGRFLIPLLVDAGYEVVAISRRIAPFCRKGHVMWLRADLSTRFPSLFAGSILIHLAPIWVLPCYIEKAAKAGVTRLVAFSSTSIFTKPDSSCIKERKLAELLAESESRSWAFAAANRIDLTLFRPTIIYSPGVDKNIDRLSRFIRFFGFFPVVGEANGLRQPVHAGDLARACVTVIDKRVTFGKEYNLCGGGTLTYRDLIKAIFKQVDKRPVLVTVSPPLFRTGMRLLSVIPGFKDLSPAMVERMQHDFTFDCGTAQRDFGYIPRAFGVDDGNSVTTVGRTPNPTAAERQSAVSRGH